MKKKIGVWGWWQGNNLGDNWIRHILESYFPDAEFVPTSETNFSEYNYIVCGGGGLFIYDVISPFDQIDINVPFGIIGMGAEFEHESNLAKRLADKADFFYVRDKYSIDCMHLAEENTSYDVTFLKPLDILPREKVDLDSVFFVWRDGHELLKNRKFNAYIQYEDTYQEWVKRIGYNFSTIRKNDFQSNEYDILSLMENSGFVISGRYHGIVAAIQRGIPFVAIDICPKIRALLQECGLEEYCVKISEIDKIDALIQKAKDNIESIREREIKYTENANKILKIQMENIKYCIAKALMPLKVIYYGSYWMGENDVVKVMADDLKKECEAIIIDLKAYSEMPDQRIKRIEPTPNGTVCILDSEKVIQDIQKYNPDAIILNSGGLCVEKKLRNVLNNQKIDLIGISLSDPDVYPYNGAKYAADFSLFYTNSKYSYFNQYKREDVNIKLLPFAASVSHHYYMPEVHKKYDLVIVGHARSERRKTVSKLTEICNVGLYGDGWKNGLGLVSGEKQVAAINSGKMYLSFSRTMAGFENVKVGLFEAMACNQFVITSYMEELEDYFKIGEELVCYKNEDELIELVQYYLAHEAEREKIRKAGYEHFLREHKYQDRWKRVLKDIYILKGLN